MGLPSWTDLNRKTDRAPINPLDRASIISIFPREIKEYNPTIFPGNFIIPAGSYENPGILIVEPSSWWREVDLNMPLLEIPVSSIAVAESIVKDYSNGILGCDMDSNRPGLFYTAGIQTVKSIKENFSNELAAINIKQRNWYGILIRMGDALWARSNGNPLAISDTMRLAAKEMGYEETKDWMKNFKMQEMVRCVACGALRNPAFPICQTCKAIADPVKAKELELTFAK